MGSGKFDGLFNDYRTARKKRTDLFYLLVTWLVLLAVVSVGVFAVIDAVADYRLKARQDKIKSPEYAAWLVQNQCQRTGFLQGEKGRIHSVYRCVNDTVYIDYEIAELTER